MAERLLRKLTAIISVDVVGYSRLMNADESGTLAELQSHRADLIDPLVVRYGGRIVKSMGDGLLLEYPSVVDAVNCSVELQDGMARRNSGVPEEKAIRFRVGVHLGEVIIEGDDIFGNGVNVASRIEGLAEPDGIAISNDVYRQVHSRIDLEWEDGGKHQVKNIPQPIWIWHRKSGNGRMQSDRGVTDCKLASSDEASIAVLPFDNMSGDPEQDYFCDGISEDLMTELARNPSLFVIARHSTFVYKNKTDDMRRIGRELGVQYVVEGSVRRSSNRIRITAQLINAKSGAHLWAERYDRDIDDVFAVQDDVVRNIVSALGQRLRSASFGKAHAIPTKNIEAYEWLVRGRQHVFRAQGRTEARDALQKAIDLEPSLSDAHAWLAVFHYSDWVFYHQHITVGTMNNALSSAETAIELNPQSALAHMSLGIVNLYGGEREIALNSLQRALELNPNDADVLVFLQEAYTFDGDPQKGIESVRQAMRLNPHFPEWYLWHLGFACYAAGQYEEATLYLRKVVDIKEPSRILAAALAMVGQVGEARQVAQNFLTVFPSFSIRQWADTQPFKDAEDLQNFIDGYRLAGLPE
ncbi:MAG: adenylate/guanylate cyclase domain-containing protein [Hyphomicrobiales bacterium]|nr:adenylate/guanylate cyclase domain-containing protein [Hyphomicrobiales bacterium]